MAQRWRTWHSRRWRPRTKGQTEDGNEDPIGFACAKPDDAKRVVEEEVDEAAAMGGLRRGIVRMDLPEGLVMETIHILIDFPR
jgi:hypothetical protein